MVLTTGQRGGREAAGLGWDDLRRWDATVFVPAPREFVFGYLAEPRNRPEWQSTLRSVRVLTDGPPRVGTRWVDEVKVGPHFELEITAVEPASLWAEVGRTGRFTAYGTLLFADETRGGVAGTKVWCLARVHGTGWARPFGYAATGLAAVLVRDDLRRVARILSDR